MAHENPRNSKRNPRILGTPLPLAGAAVGITAA